MSSSDGTVPALECLLLGARACLWLCLVMSGIKWRYFPMTRLQWHLPGAGEPPPPPQCDCQGPGGVPSQVTGRSYNGMIGG
jgi:hypothetical protein